VCLRQGFVSELSIGKEVADNLAANRYSITKRDTGAKLLRCDLSYAQVLVVDDIPTNLDVVRGMLKPYGLKITSAISGPQAIRLIRMEEPRYSAIFMDHMMPEMDGMEATRIIREEIGTDYARNIPIIALTANAIVGNEKMFLDNGFQDFISKPIDMAKLDAVLRRWVKNKSQSGADGQGQSEAPPGPLSGLELAGLDIKKALERFSGDQEALLDVLRSYAGNTPGLLDALSLYLEAGRLDDYTIVVHGIKGSSYGISANVVARAAEKLETASRAGDTAAVRAGHNTFISLAKSLLSALDELAANTGGDSGKPLAPSPEPKLLAELRRACAAYEMDSVDEVMEKLEGFRYEKGGAVIEWLREQVNGMEFELIASGEWPRE
jgi:CheY-like chemotaxis protein